MHKKRKKDDDSEWSSGKKKQRLSSNQRYIPHISRESNKPSPDEKFEIFDNIQHRRLKEKANSKHRMEYVYKLIPDSLSNVDLENTEWHRKCHQRFTMNLSRLQSESPATLEDAQPSILRSPWKRRSEEGNKFVFHMASVDSVTRRQQHLEGKCSSKNLDGPILSKWPGTCKMMGIMVCFVK